MEVLSVHPFKVGYPYPLEQCEGHARLRNAEGDVLYRRTLCPIMIQAILKGGDIDGFEQDGRIRRGFDSIYLHSPALTQGTGDLLLIPTSQFEQQEWIFVKALTQEIVYSGDMLAWIGPVRA